MEPVDGHVEIRHGGAVAARDAREDERAGLFVRRHLAQQVVDAVGHVRAVVLVDIQRAVAVKVFEVQAVHLDELLRRRGAELCLLALPPQYSRIQRRFL